jgi:hypothetical protein
MDNVSIKQLSKPSNAGWIAKAEVSPDGEFGLAAAPTSSHEHQFRDVSIAWYGQDRIKITLRGATPAAIRQAYLTGKAQDVIIDIIGLSD